MRRNEAEFAAAGAQVLVVSQGTPEQAEQFCREHHSPFPCFADPERQAYKAFALKRGTFNQVLGPAVVLKGIGAASQGFFTGRPVGDVMQLAGTFVIDTEGTVRLAHYNRDVTDHPSNQMLLDALAAIP